MTIWVSEKYCIRYTHQSLNKTQWQEIILRLLSEERKTIHHHLTHQQLSHGATWGLEQKDLEAFG